MALPQYPTAHLFHRGHILPQKDNVLNILIDKMDGPFYSHMHDVHLSPPSTEDTALMWMQFLHYYVHTYTGNDMASCFYEYYQHRSRTVPRIKQQTWDWLYGFYRGLDTSPQLRAIRLSLEKDTGDRRVVLFLYRIIEMIGATQGMSASSIHLDTHPLPSTIIPSVLNAVYGSALTSKLPTINPLLTRQSNRDILASELVYVLLSEYTRSVDIDRERRGKKKREEKRHTPQVIKNTINSGYALEFDDEDTGQTISPAKGGGKDDDVYHQDDTALMQSTKHRQPQRTASPKKLGTHSPKGRSVLSPEAERLAREDGERQGRAERAHRTMLSARDNLSSQCRYIQETRTATENRLHSTVLLCKDNIQEYNSLLEYARTMLGEMKDTMDRVKNAYRDKPRRARMPIKDENIRVYDSILTLDNRSVRDELGQIVNPLMEQGIVIPIVSSPAKLSSTHRGLDKYDTAGALVDIHPSAFTLDGQDVRHTQGNRR